MFEALPRATLSRALAELGVTSAAYIARVIHVSAGNNPATYRQVFEAVCSAGHGARWVRAAHLTSIIWERAEAIEARRAAQ
jgi:hypothetical protein